MLAATIDSLTLNKSNSTLSSTENRNACPRTAYYFHQKSIKAHGSIPHTSGYILLHICRCGANTLFTGNPVHFFVGLKEYRDICWSIVSCISILIRITKIHYFQLSKIPSNKFLCHEFRWRIAKQFQQYSMACMSVSHKTNLVHIQRGSSLAVSSHPHQTSKYLLIEILEFFNA